MMLRLMCREAVTLAKVMITFFPLPSPYHGARCWHGETDKGPKMSNRGLQTATKRVPGVTILEVLVGSVHRAGKRRQLGWALSWV